MTKKQRIVKALGILREDAPEIYDSIINGDCPHEAGLKEPNAGKCGFNEVDSAFVMGYCSECWRLALEG